jgi:hypothetical protein
MPSPSTEAARIGTEARVGCFVAGPQAGSRRTSVDPLYSAGESKALSEVQECRNKPG